MIDEAAAPCEQAEQQGKADKLGREEGDCGIKKGAACSGYRLPTSPCLAVYFGIRHPAFCYDSYNSGRTMNGYATLLQASGVRVLPRGRGGGVSFTFAGSST